MQSAVNRQAARKSREPIEIVARPSRVLAARLNNFTESEFTARRRVSLTVRTTSNEWNCGATVFPAENNLPNVAWTSPTRGSTG